jgi:hypothetical protein
MGGDFEKISRRPDTSHSMRDSTQVSSQGATIIMMMPAISRSNEQNRHTPDGVVSSGEWVERGIGVVSRCPMPIALAPHPLCEPAHPSRKCPTQPTGPRPNISFKPNGGREYKILSEERRGALTQAGARRSQMNMPGRVWDDPASSKRRKQQP